VIGAVGFAFSNYAKAVCQLLGPARVPVISFYASSDSLSNKNRFPYFVRTLPPDRYVQAEVEDVGLNVLGCRVDISGANCMFR